MNSNFGTKALCSLILKAKSISDCRKREKEEEKLRKLIKEKFLTGNQQKFERSSKEFKEVYPIIDGSKTSQIRGFITGGGLFLVRLLQEANNFDSKDSSSIYETVCKALEKYLGKILYERDYFFSKKNEWRRVNNYTTSDIITIMGCKHLLPEDMLNLITRFHMAPFIQESIYYVTQILNSFLKKIPNNDYVVVSKFDINKTIG